ncbi:hypothetical protein AX17_007161 [Amanita inopinata Kibby_2008]|nr:hypothetical protein AX17_007161 [Amanita inopinata Kibby_2008]
MRLSIVAVVTALLLAGFSGAVDTAPASNSPAPATRRKGIIPPPDDHQRYSLDGTPNHLHLGPGARAPIHVTKRTNFYDPHSLHERGLDNIGHRISDRTRKLFAGPAGEPKKPKLKAAAWGPIHETTHKSILEPERQQESPEPISGPHEPHKRSVSHPPRSNDLHVRGWLKGSKSTPSKAEIEPKPPKPTSYPVAEQNADSANASRKQQEQEFLGENGLHFPDPMRKNNYKPIMEMAALAGSEPSRGRTKDKKRI